MTIDYAHSNNALRHRFFRIKEGEQRYVNELFRSDHLEKADAFIIKKMIAPHELEIVRSIYTKVPNKMFVYDPDVNYFEDTYRDLITERHQQTADYYLSISQAQMCSSMYLVNVLAKRNPYWIPTCVPYREIKRYGLNKRLKVGWCGQASKAEDLLLVGSLFGKDSDFELVIVSNDRPVNLFLPSYTFVQYHEEIFENELRDIDIAISPRHLSNTYNMGHSELKIINWMSIGVPVIASPQPSYTQTIQHESTGYLAENIHQWIRCFSMLKDPAKRQEVGQAGYQHVRRWYSTDRISELFENMLDDLLS